MTSHQFSANKNAAKYDFKTALKSIIAPTVLTFISSVLVFVAAPLDVFTIFYDGRFKIADLHKEYALLLTGMSNGQYVGIYFLFLGALFAVTAFSFIMKKKAVNVFLSASVDRRTLYKNRILACTAMIAAAIAIPIVVDAAINICFF